MRTVKTTLTSRLGLQIQIHEGVKVVFEAWSGISAISKMCQGRQIRHSHRAHGLALGSN